jgi:hypothetical protein
MTISRQIGKFIQIKTQKTGEIVTIPIHPMVRSIMQKYVGKTENSLPSAISNVKMNKYLKDLGEKIEFNELITLEKNKAGRVEKISQPLHY